MSSADRDKAATIIQKHVRGVLVRSHHKQFVHNLKQRKYIVNEIFSSERAYVKTLDVIVNVFYKPLKQAKVVDKSVIKCIFANITDIHTIHVELLKEMAVTPHLIGSVFLKSIPSFRAYKAYIANYTTTLTTFNAWMDKKAFGDRVKACCTPKNGLQPSDLPGLLNKPVQQLSRYKLLLEDLLSKTNQQNEDYSDLQKAVVALKQVIEGGQAPESPRANSPDSSSSSDTRSVKSHQSVQSTSSNASLARKLNAIAQAPHNLPYKLSPFVSRSVSNTPTGVSPSPYNPGDPSLPSYLRPTHTSYARANEGRSKKEQVAYTNLNNPTWMPNGKDSEQIYHTVYNAIPYTPRKSEQGVLDRSGSGKTWLPTPATPRSFDAGMARSASALGVRETSMGPESPKTPRKSPGGKNLNSSLTSTSARSLISPSPSPSKPTTPRKPPSTTATPTKTPSKSTIPAPTATPTKTPSKTAVTTTTTTTTSTPTKAPTITVTPSKQQQAARAAGSNIPMPKTPSNSSVSTPNSKSSGLHKSPSQTSQNGLASKIPVLKKSPSTTIAEKADAEVVEDANGVDEEDETMTF